MQQQSIQQPNSTRQVIFASKKMSLNAGYQQSRSALQPFRHFSLSSPEQPTLEETEPDRTTPRLELREDEETAKYE